MNLSLRKVVKLSRCMHVVYLSASDALQHESVESETAFTVLRFAYLLKARLSALPQPMSRES